MDGSKIAQVAAERPFGTTSELHLLSVGFPFKQEQQVQEGVTVKCARVHVWGLEVSVAHLPFPCCGVLYKGKRRWCIKSSLCSAV